MKTSYQNYPITILNVGFSIHNANWNWQNVRSPFARLYYVTEGYAEVEIHSIHKGDPNRIMKLYPEHLYFIPSFTTHSYHCKGHFAHYYIHIYEQPDCESTLLEAYDFPSEMQGDDSDLTLFQRLCSINPFMKLPGSDPLCYDNNSMLIQNITRNSLRPLADILETHGILYQLISKLLRRATPRSVIEDTRIGAAIKYIRKHIGDTLDISELAHTACMSKDYFIRRFKAETGSTPVVYITQRRIERAELLLNTTTHPVKNISLMLGYEDFSYFNRVFRKHTGISPLKYRNSSTYCEQPEIQDDK